MARAGSTVFKIGYNLYSKTPLGYLLFRKDVKKARTKYKNTGHSVTSATTLNGVVIKTVPISLDNYSYVVTDTENNVTVLIDAADPSPIQNLLNEDKLTPSAVLTTHKHWDHSAGNKAWRRKYPDIDVYGTSIDSVPGANKSVQNEERLTFGNLNFMVHFTPGHTRGHCVYLLENSASPALFSGDHLFLGGCGRMFECEPSEMLKSLDLLSSLPDETLIFPGHEYAESNLEFALNLEPENQNVLKKHTQVKELRENNTCTSPSTMKEEKLYNPFLRTDDENIIKLMGFEMDQNPTEQFIIRAKALGEIRARKDNFKYKL